MELITYSIPEVLNGYICGTVIQPIQRKTELKKRINRKEM
jgi:hypothetical protein